MRTSQTVNYREHHDERTSDDEGSGGERAQVYTIILANLYRRKYYRHKFKVFLSIRE